MDILKIIFVSAVRLYIGPHTREHWKMKYTM